MLDNNSLDGGNWENSCLYYHDNEHQRYVGKVRGYGGLAPAPKGAATSNPFAGLAEMLDQKKGIN